MQQQRSSIGTASRARYRYPELTSEVFARERPRRSLYLLGNPSSDDLASMDNVILTPHLGASSQEAMWRMATQVADGVLRVLNGERPDFPVVI